MHGTAKRMIDRLVAVRSGGDEVLAMSTTTRLTLKGLDPSKFTATTPDHPADLARVRQVAAEWGIALP